jgi:hypothetical protein
MNPIAIYFFALLAAVAQIVGILSWLKIEPKNIFSRDWWAMFPVNITKGKLILILGFGIFSLILSSYGFYLIHSTSSSVGQTVAGIHFSEKPIVASGRADLPFELEVTVNTDFDRVSPTQLFIVCSDIVGDGRAELEKAGPFAIMGSYVGSLPTLGGDGTRDHPDVYVVKWRIPAWKAGTPLIVQLWSKTKINVQYVIPVVYH